MHDSVNHPKHYTSHPSGVECIQVTRHMGFNVGNAVKYLWRADLKHDDGGLEDLRKAVWYIQDEIMRREKEAARGAPIYPSDYVKAGGTLIVDCNKLSPEELESVIRSGPPTPRSTHPLDISGPRSDRAWDVA